MTTLAVFLYSSLTLSLKPLPMSLGEETEPLHPFSTLGVEIAKRHRTLVKSCTAFSVELSFFPKRVFDALFMCLAAASRQPSSSQETSLRKRKKSNTAFSRCRRCRHHKACRQVGRRCSVYLSISFSVAQIEVMEAPTLFSTLPFSCLKPSLSCFDKVKRCSSGGNRTDDARSAVGPRIETGKLADLW